jgi:hypothetical protein
MLRTIVLFILFLSSGYLYAADHGGQVTDTKFNYRAYSDSSHVFTIGHIQNSGKYPLEDIVIEVQFFDGDGELIDVTRRTLYNIRILPKEKAPFKIETFAAHKQELYVSQEVHIIDADQDIPCSSNSKKGFISDLIGMLLPIVIFFAIFILLMRKYQGKGSNQDKLVNLMERQVDLVEAQNIELSKIAEALKNKTELK